MWGPGGRLGKPEELRECGPWEEGCSLEELRGVWDPGGGLGRLRQGAGVWDLGEGGC